MAADSSIQSLDRGLQVLKLLSRTPSMTATAIAADIGVHQSSASRLLNSLLKAGFVRKPDFHSFALDYGALAFAGYALNCFPEIKACTAACNHITNKYDFSAATGILRDGRILYLTQIHKDATIAMLDDTGFPLHQSSIGLALACEKEKDEALALIADSITRLNQSEEKTLSPEMIWQEAENIYARTMKNIEFHDYFYQTDSPLNVINGAKTFTLGNELAAIAVYHNSQTCEVGQMRKMLKGGIEYIYSMLEKNT